MLEQMTLDGIERLPVQLSIWSDNRVSVLYHELHEQLADSGYESLSEFKEHINNSTDPGSVLSECQIIANRR